MKAKATLLEQNVLVSPALAHGRHHRQGPVFPWMSICANLSFSRPVIRWMSAQWLWCLLFAALLIAGCGSATQKGSQPLQRSSVQKVGIDQTTVYPGQID